MLTPITPQDYLAASTLAVYTMRQHRGTMNYRTLPKTELDLSEVGFGVWTVSTPGWGTAHVEDQHLLLRTAFELGITFFNTADLYGEGYGEEVLAAAFPKERHDIVIATKGGYDFYDKLDPLPGPWPRQKFQPDFIRYACEQSLRRLRTDYIDLYQLHYADMWALEDEELFGTLEELVKEGKIRYFGVSLGPTLDVEGGRLEEAHTAICERQAHSLEIPYSILEQQPALQVFPIAADLETGILAREPHAHQALTSRIPVAVSASPDQPGFNPHERQMALALKHAQELQFLAQDTGRTLAQSALRFCLAQPTITSVLPNITNLHDLAEYAAAPDTADLYPEEEERLQELWEELLCPEEYRPREEEC